MPRGWRLYRVFPLVVYQYVERARANIVAALLCVADPMFGPFSVVGGVSGVGGPEFAPLRMVGGVGNHATTQFPCIPIGTAYSC